jgi:Tfp pilus assembly protein PilO
MVRLIISVVCVVAAIGIFLAYTQPTYDSVQAINGQIGQYNEALSKATELQNRKQELLSKYNTFDQASIDRLQKLLPDHVDNIRLILDLDSLAAKHSIAIQNVSVSSADSAQVQSTTLGSVSAAKQSYDSLTMKFTTQASYSTFEQFLTDLEESLRIVDLESLSIARADSGQGLYTFNITLRTYWLK